MVLDTAVSLRQRQGNASMKNQVVFPRCERRQAARTATISKISLASMTLLVLLLGDSNQGGVCAWSHPARPQRATERSLVSNRRAFLAAIAAGSVATIIVGGEPRVAAAAEPDATAATATSTATDPAISNRPRAPTDALVPATQQRALLEMASVLAKKLADSRSSDDSTVAKALILTQLEEIFEPPTQPTANKSSVSMTRRYKVDEQVLQRAVSTRVSGATARAAMNVFTANLQFGESYVLTASLKDRRSLIRQYDGLPDFKQVITSDLDLRDLYRNQAQTTIEDVQAELYRDEPDAHELVVLLGDARATFDSWFELISPSDIRDAVERAGQVASSDTEKVKLPDHNFRGYNFVR